MFERDLRTLSFVPRWVITRNIRTQSVAEHSFYVAVYAGQLAHYLEYEGDLGTLLHYALWHDVEEVFTGDIPGPAKRSMVGDQAELWLMMGLQARFGFSLAPLTGEGKLIIKIANLLDEVFYKATEIQMGNRGAMHEYKLSSARLYTAFQMLSLSQPRMKDLWMKIDDAINLHLAGQDKLPENNSDLAAKH